MRVPIAIICFLIVACKNEGKPQMDLQKAWTVASVDSFQLGRQKVFLKTLVHRTRDSFQLICENDNSNYLKLTLEQPPGSIRAQNITGDSLPEVIVDDCLGCDLGRLRLFSFDRTGQRFRELKGTDSLLSDIYQLNGTDMIYNVACFNQGGCESTLLRVVNDSCISIGRMYVPYGEGSVQLKRSLNQSTKLIPKPNGLDVDSLVPYLWKEHFLKNKSQQPTAALKNKG